MLSQDLLLVKTSLRGPGFDKRQSAKAAVGVLMKKKRNYDIFRISERLRRVVGNVALKPLLEFKRRAREFLTFKEAGCYVGVPKFEYAPPFYQSYNEIQLLEPGRIWRSSYDAQASRQS